MLPARALVFAALALPPTLSVGVAARLEGAARDFGATLGSASAMVAGARLGDEPRPSDGEADVVSRADLVLQLADADGAAHAIAGAKAHGKQRGHGASRAKVGHGVRVSAGAVLHLARAGVVPVGRLVPASGARPAGIELSQVTALGIGMKDGDVLTEVLGRSVLGEGEIVGIVLAARNRHENAISGVFYRGQEPWALVVEMPYL